MDYTKKNKSSSKGVSLISLVVTIIVLIILATMFISRTSNLPTEATYAKFSEEILSVDGAVETIRTQNATNGDSEAKINAGFKKVTIINPPRGFESFDKGINYTSVTGYAIDTEAIGYNNATYGKGYNSGDNDIEFLKDDVFVYDATGTVYYAKGVLRKDVMIHTFADGLNVNENINSDGPIITNVTVTSGDLSTGEKTWGKAKIVISAFPKYNGNLKVMVREIIAEKVPGRDEYVAQVSRNGIYTIIVTEENHGRTVQKVNVSEIVETSVAPSNLSIIINDGEQYTTSSTANVALRADGATKMLITKDEPAVPDLKDLRWETYRTNFEFDLGSTEKRYTLYAWFKDDFSNITNKIVKSSILYDQTPPSTNQPTIKMAGPYAIIESNQTDNLAQQSILDANTEYGYKEYLGLINDSDGYTWSKANIVGPLDMDKTYEFITKTTDEAMNTTLSTPSSPYTIRYDYIINFNLNGGTPIDGEISPMYTTNGVSITLPLNNLQRAGYVLKGWSEFENPSSETDIYLGGSEYTPMGATSQKMLYAIWQPGYANYTVEHWIETEIAGSYELIGKPEQFSGEVGKIVVAISKTATGNFVGLVQNTNHPKNLASAVLKGDGTTKLALYYYSGKYDLTVVGDNASVSGTSIDIPFKREVSIKALMNEGYEFVNWEIENSNSSEEYDSFISPNGRYDAISSFKMLPRDTRLRAVTRLQRYPIRYVLNGGTLGGENPTQYDRATESFSLINPTKSGYVFLGWQSSILDGIQPDVTVVPSNLEEVGELVFEAKYSPSSDILNIIVEPQNPTNGNVTVKITSLDPTLRIEYSVANEGSWNIYYSAFEVTENTTIFAKLSTENEKIFESGMTISNIDKEKPVITGVETSNEWDEGEKYSVKVTATDNNGVTGYAITQTETNPDVNSFETSGNELQLNEGQNFIWVKDAAGNMEKQEIHVWDISKNTNKNIYAVINKDNEMRIIGTGETKSYENYSATPYNEFRNEIVKVIIEEGITTIGNHVLSSMQNLNEISISKTLSNIEKMGMIYSNNYESITIASDNNYFSYDNFTLFDKNKTIIYMHSRKDQNDDYTIPTTVDEIGDFAFYNNNQRKIIVTSNPSVGKNAFELCSNLYEIEGEIGGTTISMNAFARCDNLHLINISSILERIESEAFYDTKSLQLIVIPISINYIPNEAAQGRVFAGMGSNYAKGIVRYYESSTEMREYATRYSNEVRFEMIDDVQPELITLRTASPESGVYPREREIRFVATFNEELSEDVSGELPKLAIRIGEGSIREISNGIIIDDEIVYKYITKEEDYGNISFVGYSGEIRDIAGNIKNINANTMSGSEIRIDTAVELEDGLGVKYYSTLQDALNGANIGSEEQIRIRLLKNINENVTVPINRNILLDLGQKTLSSVNNTPLITNRARLEITGDGTLQAEGTIIKNEQNSMIYADNISLFSSGDNKITIQDISDSEINLDNVIINSRGIAIESNGVLNIENSTIETISGPAIMLNTNAICDLNNTNVSATTGYAIFVSRDARLEIENGSVNSVIGTGINNNGITNLEGTTINSSGIGGIINGVFGALSLENISIEIASENASVYGISTRSDTKVVLKNSIIIVSSQNETAIGIEIHGTSGIIIKESAVMSTSEKMGDNSAFGICNPKGEVTMGENDGIVNENAPEIISSDVGYFSIDGTLNYCDGRITGDINKSMECFYIYKPAQTTINVVTDEVENSETSYISEDIV